MMSIADTFGIVFTPLMALGVLLFAAMAFWKVKRQRTWPTYFVWLALALILCPMFLVVVFFFDQTAMMIVNQYIFLLVVGVMVVAFPWTGAARMMDQKLGTALTWFFRIAAPPLGVVMLAIVAWFLVGDFLLPRQYAEGIVGHMSVGPVKYGLGMKYRVQIGGTNYPTTGEVYDAISPGHYVRAEIGSGSRTILKVQQSSTPNWLGLPPRKGT